MANITTRAGKGSPLTNAEVDANFTNLNAELGQKLVASSNLSDLANAATARTNLGLGNVENKSSATIRGELTSGNVTTALGFTPYNATNPSGYITSAALSSYLPLAGGTVSGIVSLTGVNPTPLEIVRTGSNANANMRFSNTASTTFFGIGAQSGELRVGTTVDIYNTGNIVLHSGNYNSYSPALTGSGASGTWGISITGNAATVTNGLVSTGSYADPSWITSLASSKLTGTIDNARLNGGTYTINVTGNAGTATTLQTARTINGVSFNGSANITVADSTKLPLSGGTMTGDLTVTRMRATHSLVLNTYATVNPSSNVFLYSQGNDRDSWIYLDSADTGSNWGIYHRQIDSAVSGLPGNSIGFVGGGTNTLQAWISLANGSANFAGALTQAGNQVLHAGNYSTYSPSYGYFDDYQRGAYRVIADHGSQNTWYIRSNGRFTWARAHDWSQSFDLDLGSGTTNSNDGWARFGQQTSNSTAGTWRGTRFVQYTGGTSIDGFVRAGRYYLGDDTNHLTQGGGGAVRVQTASGYIDVGSMNTSHAHLQTDRPSFYFNKDVLVDGQLYRYSGNLPYLHSGNYSSYSSFSGAVTSGGNTGFRNDVYYGAVRNPIWSFGNAGAYGISYFQGSAGIGGADVIGIHPNGSPTATGSSFAVGTSNSYVNNNIVLHAGNYSSYAVPQSDVSTSGGGSVILKTASNGYLYVNNWINTGGGGLFSGTNSAHFYPNDADYGAWKISGSRNGWAGIYFDTGSTLMMNSDTVGFHRSGYGWQLRWAAGVGYVHKGNPGGGTEAAILDSSNYTSYSPSLGGSGASGTWNISITGRSNSVIYLPNRTDAAAYPILWGAAYTDGSGTHAYSCAAVTLRSSDGTIFSTSLRGSGNVAGTGEATHHPAGIYSTGTNWLYGQIITNGASINAGGATCTLTATRANRANGNFYIDDNFGCGIVGNYSASRYQGVFFMGDSYKMSADGTSLANMYGIGWSHPNAGGAAGNLTDHGMLIINNGSFRCAISNSIVASGNITAYSDERLKTNWRDLPENFVARLAKVKVGIYDRLDEENVTQVGVSAQSFQQLLPQAIMTAKDEMSTLSVSYGNAALASAVELAKDNVELRARIERLEALIEKLIGD